MSGKAKHAAACATVSMLLLVPCFWQPRIQAGDLSSHIYNSWLAQLVERGEAPGLTLASQSNNVLFDLMLAGLMRAWGPGPAQRVAVSAAVLIFFWGAFAFVRSFSRERPRRAPWRLAPFLAVLAYGWVFRMGLFNFYISLGLCFAAMALLRGKKAWTPIAAIVLFGVAYVAHALPVAWSAGILVYARVAQALAPRHRSRLMVGVLAALTLTAMLLARFFPTRRGLDQVLSMTGADQLWVYGTEYAALGVAVLALGAACFQRVVHERGLHRTLLDVRFQLCVLSMASLVILPAGVLLPGFRSGLDFVAERMSLAGAVLFCALLVSTPLPKALVAAGAGVAVIFFGLSYRDERMLNRVEDRMADAVAQLPPGQRVVSALEAPDSRIRSMLHLVDRVCIGKCFSYANYEPCTWQFRVRAVRDNPFVVANYGDSWDLQTGGYVVKSRDLPLYRIDLCGRDQGEVCLAPLDAGDRLRNRGVQVANLRGKEPQ